MPLTPPRAALVLGYAGLLPPLAAMAVEWQLRETVGSGPGTLMVAMPALGYAALILSFLGGTWWAGAVDRLAGDALWRWLALAVLPSLWAAASFFGGWIAAPPVATGLFLATGLLLSLLIDRAAVARGLVPGWWMRLRLPLSLGLAAETIVVALLA